MSSVLPHPLHRLITNVPLRWVLTVPFVLPTIGAVALVGYLSYRNGQAAVENLGHQLVAATNDRVAQELKTYVQTPLLINRLNVDAVHQSQLDLQNVPALEAALFNRLQQFEQVSAVLFANPQGTFRLVDRLPELYLVVADPPRPDQIRIYQMDSQGKPGKLVHTNDGLDVRRDRPWYQRAVTTGQLGWNPISQYGSLKLLTLDASQPVYDRSTKRLLGVFAVHIRLDYLSEFLYQLDISRSGRVLITDNQGALVATSTQEQPYQFVAGTGYHQQFQQLHLAESRDGLTRSLGEYLRDRPDVLQSLEQSQYLEFRYNGEPQYVKITPFQDQYGLNWRILTVIPQSHFLATIQTNARTTALLCLLTLGGAIGLGMIAANRLTTRFAQLNRVSREFAAGNLNQRLPTDSPIYELNSLAQTFNQMADHLQQSFNRIQTALEESEEKFTAAFHNSPDPMAIASLAECKLLEVNDSLIEFFGYSRSEMIGRTALELNLWSNLNQHDQYKTLLQQQGTVRNLEVQLRTRLGAVKTALLSSEVRTLEGQDCILIVHRDISVRKATELALQQSEARYRAIVEDQTELIARSLPDTTLLFVNDAYCRYFGISREEIIGKSYSPTIYEADRQQVAQLIQSMSVNNPTVVGENRLVVNGSIRWTQWVSRMLFDAQGNVTEIQSVGRDITQLKQTEEALRKSETQLLQAQRIVHVGSWEFDLTTEKITWSEELFHIFGFDPTQLEPSYTEILEIVPVEDRSILITAINQAIADGTPYEVEHRICRPDGTLRYVISKGQAVLSDQQVLKLYGTALDITDRKHAEAEIQQLNQQLTHRVNELQTLFNVLPIGVAISEDPECRIAHSNPRLSELLRVPFDANASQSAPSSERPAYRVYREGQEVSSEALPMQYAAAHNVEIKDETFDIVHPDGTVINLLCYASPLRDAQGKVRGAIGGFVDITERKRLEQSLRSQAEEERLLTTITQNIHQSLDLEQILATTVIEVQQTLSADRALIFRLNQDGSGQVMQEAVVPAYPVTDQMRWEDEHFPEDCYTYYQQGIPRIVPDVATDEWAICLSEFMQQVGVKSKVIAPIVQSGAASAKVWGLLIVHACSHYRQWQESEADFLQRICNQLAIAIDQANLYQQLQEREAMLRAIGDNLPKGFIYQRVYEPGKGSYYSYVSAGVERLLGLKPEAILANAKTTRTVGFEEELAQADQAMQESLKHLTPIELQMRNRTAQGDVQWSSIRSVPRRLNDGRTVWDGVEVDITDLKRVEEALRVSEEQFRRAFGDAPIGISLVSPTGQFVKVNTCYCNLLEYTEAELLATTFQAITHPADRNADL